MLKTLWTRASHGHKTIGFPKDPPTLPERFRGMPLVDEAKCKPGCTACAQACPTSAITITDGKPLGVDLGRCMFCTDCAAACPTEALTYSKDYRLATRRREDLLCDAKTLKLATELQGRMKKIFGRSLKLRQVSAGGCNACEADVNVLSTIVFDLGRFGIQFVASPRHADGLLITGPVTQNMRLALQKTYEAVPEPKLVIAVGTCAISGGPFSGLPESNDGASGVVPVDLFIPGCPPHPITTLDGLLRLLRKID